MIRFALLLLVCSPGLAAAQSSAWTNPRDPFQIADDLYYVGS
ncbi:MAG: subclass B3 metallo-beta-lactamase, partial [Gemmatimonadetes bacterium]|nr:subclass B3 metallo-beta-lactamase [Gemmatimonadota bacterium]